MHHHSTDLRPDFTECDTRYSATLQWQITAPYPAATYDRNRNVNHAVVDRSLPVNRRRRLTEWRAMITLQCCWCELLHQQRLRQLLQQLWAETAAQATATREQPHRQHGALATAAPQRQRQTDCTSTVFGYSPSTPVIQRWSGDRCRTCQLCTVAQHEWCNCVALPPVGPSLSVSTDRITDWLTDWR